MGSSRQYIGSLEVTRVDDGERFTRLRGPKKRVRLAIANCTVVTERAAEGINIKLLNGY